MDLFSIIVGVSIPLTIGCISKIICKCKDRCECSCLQGLGAVGNNNQLFARSRTFSFKNQF